MQTKTKEVAIIIPYINLPDYLLELIKTIYTKYTYHIYLIDNASSEKTKKKLADLGKREYITIIENETNIGCAVAWNQGIKTAVSERNIDYAVILNNDIILHHDCIDNMIGEIKAGGFPFVSGIDVCKECAKPIDVLELDVPAKKFVVDEPEFSCYTVDIKLLDKLREREENIEEYPGLFDQKFHPAYFEDNDFHYRIKLAKMRAVKLNTALYYHYGSRTILSNEEVLNISNNYYSINAQRYVEKWGGGPRQEKFKIPFDQEE